MIRLFLALGATASLALAPGMAADVPAGPGVETGAPGDIASNEELSKILLELGDSKTEMGALRRLIKFSGRFLYEGSLVLVTGDPKGDKLRRSAGRALRSHRNPGIVRRALDDDDEDVRSWGVMSFETTFGKREPWVSLLPRLEEIASHDASAGFRLAAIEKLGSYEQATAFLATLRQSTNETEPAVLMTLLRFPESPGAWNARAVEFLSGKDEALRLLWVFYIWDNVRNPFTAPMWRIKADPKLVESLRQLELTGQKEVREYARKILEAFTTGHRPDAQQDAAANRSQPVPPSTNRPSAAPGSGR